MVQIIDNVRQPSTADRFANAFSNLGQQGGQEIVNYYQRQKEAAQRDKNEQLISELTGVDRETLRGISPEHHGELLKQGGQQGLERLRQKGAFDEARLKAEAPDEKQGEKVRGLEGARERVAEMKRIRAKGNLGRLVGVKSFFGGESAKDKGSYETLGRSLINQASTIPVKNRQEFETLSHGLIDASVTDDEADGILTELERIINDSIYEASGERPGEIEELDFDEEEVRPKSQSKKPKKSLGAIFS